MININHNSMEATVKLSDQFREDLYEELCYKIDLKLRDQLRENLYGKSHEELHYKLCNKLRDKRSENLNDRLYWVPDLMFMEEIFYKQLTKCL